MKKADTVAAVLEAEAASTIADWLRRADSEPDIMAIAMTPAERSAHLPDVLRDLVVRLRNPLPLGTPALTSDAAHEHGCLRREQGYTAAMMVEESRMLQVSVFETLKLHRETMDMSDLMTDIMSIADEVDSQLAQAMTSYIAEANRDEEAILA